MEQEAQGFRFVPVAAGSRGRRGFDQAETRRLRTLLDRYKALRDDPASSPALRSYSAEIIRELRAEFSRRQSPATVEAVAA